MYCYVHPENTAVATCVNCGKAVCEECVVDVAGQIHCKQCVASHRTVGKTSLQTPSVPTNPIAIISLVLGILGLCGCACGGAIGGFLFGIPAAITGWVARKQILESAIEQQGMPFATIGLILGIAEMVLALIAFFIFGAVFGLSFLSELLASL